MLYEYPASKALSATPFQLPFGMNTYRIPCMAKRSTEKEMTWKKAIATVLREANGPMTKREITERIEELGLRMLTGARPSHYVGMCLYSNSKKPDSPFLQVGPGSFVLRNTGNEVMPPSYQDDDEADGPDEREDSAIINAFGMFWRRELVDWKQKPKLLGQQLKGSDAVNFCDQQGIYLLYDGREVIYVGRSVDRPIGQRLFEHTRDRLATRWDRFSWFGILPVSNNGELGAPPDTVQADLLLPTFEALLIEALEPRQNRKRGDDLQDAEFIQLIDPSIKKRQLKDFIDQMN